MFSRVIQQSLNKLIPLWRTWLAIASEFHWC